MEYVKLMGQNFLSDHVCGESKTTRFEAKRQNASEYGAPIESPRY